MIEMEDGNKKGRDENAVVGDNGNVTGKRERMRDRRGV